MLSVMKKTARKAAKVSEVARVAKSAEARPATHSWASFLAHKFNVVNCDARNGLPGDGLQGMMCCGCYCSRSLEN